MVPENAQKVQIDLDFDSGAFDSIFSVFNGMIGKSAVLSVGPESIIEASNVADKINNNFKNFSISVLLDVDITNSGFYIECGGRTIYSPGA